MVRGLANLSLGHKKHYRGESQGRKTLNYIGAPLNQDLRAVPALGLSSTHATFFDNQYHMYS
jgi:hypothetical protein